MAFRARWSGCAIFVQNANSKEKCKMSKRFWSYSKFAILTAAFLGTDAGSLQAQSLWKEEYSQSMVADKRATMVGDIVTILVQENNTASKDNSTSTSKKSGVDAAIEALVDGQYSQADAKHAERINAVPAFDASAYRRAYPRRHPLGHREMCAAPP